MKTRAIVVMAVVSVLLLTGVVSCATPEAEQPEAEQPEDEEQEATPPAEEELEKFTIKQSDDNPDTSQFSILGVQPFGTWVEDVSQGRCTVDFYPLGALHSNKDGYMAVQSGITDITKLWHPAMVGTFPLMDMFSLPGLMPQSIVINTQIANDMFSRWPQFEEQYSDQVEWVYIAVVMGSHIHSTEPIRSLDDLEGKVISCTSEPAATALNLLGASATVMTDGADVYLGLQRGVLDGAFAAWGWVNNWKINEVAPYHLLVGISPGSVGGVMNKQTFERFTPFEQFLIKQYRYAGAYNSNLGLIVGAAMPSRAEIPDDQVFVISNEELAEVNELLRPMWDAWVEANKDKFPAQEILDDCLALKKAYTGD